MFHVQTSNIQNITGYVIWVHSGVKIITLVHLACINVGSINSDISWKRLSHADEATDKKSGEPSDSETKLLAIGTEAEFLC